MAIDAFTNFAKARVSTGYASGATSIILATGGGARFTQALPFNATWWNSSDYPDPADDPNREIVTVTGLSSNTLTIARGQEGTTASAKNITGKTYTLVAGITAKTLTALKTGVTMFRQAGRLAIPPGIRLRAGNIALHGGDWRDLFFNWDSLWSTWTKPQIDKAKALGMNAVRLITPIDAIVEGAMTRAYFQSKYKQLLDYCLEQGIYVYATGGGWYQYAFYTFGAGFIDNDANLNLILAEQVAFGAFLDPYPHVIGYDVMQEGFFVKPNNRSMAQMHTLYTAWFTAIRAVTNIPLTCSSPVDNAVYALNNSQLFTDLTDAAAAAVYMDFIDMHVYYPLTISDVSNFITAIGGKSFIVGEVNSGTTGDTSQTVSDVMAQTTFMVSGPALGGFFWAIADTSSASDGRFGLYSFENFTPRTDLINLVKQWPRLSTSAAPATSLKVFSVNTTYYASTTGNDSNDGLSSGAPLTLQGAFNKLIGTVIPGGITVVIHLLDGTYSTSSGFALPGFIGGGVAILRGNTGARTNVTIQDASDFNAFATLSINDSGLFNWQIEYIRIHRTSTGGGGPAINVNSGGLSIGAGVTFGVHNQDNGGIQVYGRSSTLTINGPVVYLEPGTWGTFLSLVNCSANMFFDYSIDAGGGTVAFNTAFLDMSITASALFAHSSSAIPVVNGSVTGKRAAFNTNAAAKMYNGGSADSYFPGTVASTFANGGVAAP